VSALDAALERAAVADLSAWPRLLATGPAFLGLLHRLSTGDVEGLRPGEGRPTVVTTPKGRILARLIVLHLGGEGVLALGGPGTGDRVRAHLTKYALGEDIGLTDAPPAPAYAIVGPRWREVARVLGAPDLAPYGTALTTGTPPVRVARTNGFDGDGLLVLGEAPLDAPRLSPQDLEVWRVLTRRRLAGRELTEDYNPLEAGLADSVSFTKGCYVGQEVVARLNTYDKVARGVVALEMEGAAPLPGARLAHGEREIGTVTSAVVDPRTGAIAALGYVKRRDLPSGVETIDVVSDSGRAPARIVTR
jgi:folate-binding protein YgfZ